jgi:aerobic C4-dicarboxylate transport protein
LLRDCYAIIMPFICFNIMKKIYQNLSFWVLTALVFGVLLGHYAPAVALKPVLAADFKMQFLGQELKIGSTLSEFLSGLFISIVKLFINPIIFLTIVLGIVQMGDLKKVGTLGAKALLYFEVVTTFALLIGIFVANVLRPGDGIVLQNTSDAHLETIAKYNEKAMDFSFWEFFKHNSTLQVLLFAILFGIFLSKYSKRENIIRVFNRISAHIFGALHRVMLIAPLGAFGGIAFTIAKYGLHTLLPLAKLMASVYVTMFIFIVLVLGAILRHAGVNLWRFLYDIRAELLIVLGTSSSESALPNLMEKLEKMGCAKSVVGLVVPTGYAFNLDGTTIYLSMAVIFLAQVFHVEFSLTQMLTLVGILMVTSKGAAGVTGSGFIVLASTLTALKIIPLEGLTLLIGVDRFMSEARAITNFIGNAVATVWLAKHEEAFSN